MGGASTSTASPGIAGVHSHTGMAGRVAAGRHSATGTADPGVHAVIVCIGIGGAYTGIARVTAGCVAACWVCTDCTGIDKAGTV